MSVPLHAAGPLIHWAKDAPPVTIEALTGTGGVLIIAPHPDDETLGCGQALYSALEAGHQVAIVLLTDGEGSHPASASYPPDRLKHLRQREFAEALHALTGSCVPVSHLSMPDGRTTPAQLTDAHLAQAIEAVRAVRARAIWTTWEHDPHCDHQTGAALARQVATACDAKLWQFPVWGRFSNIQERPDLFVFHNRHALAAKRRAAEAYRSQFTDLIADDPDAFRMPPDLLAHFLDHPELFIRG